MVDSGVRLEGEAKKTLQLIQEKKAARTAEYLIFELKKPDGKKYVCDIRSAPPTFEAPSSNLSEAEIIEINKENWNKFKKDLSDPDENGQHHPAFGVGYVRKGNHEKLVFIYWCPENSKVGEKMIYSSTKDTVKKAAAANKNFEVDEVDELSYERMAKECGL